MQLIIWKIKKNISGTYFDAIPYFTIAISIKNQRQKREVFKFTIDKFQHHYT